MMRDLGRDRAEKLYRQKAETIDERTSVLRRYLYGLFRYFSMVFTLSFLLSVIYLIPGIFYGWDLLRVIGTGVVCWIIGAGLNIAAERVKNPRREDLDDV